MGMRIYADWCSLQRAHDLLNTAKLRGQADTFSCILGTALDSPAPFLDPLRAQYRLYEDPEEDETWGLVYSDALRYEIGRCPKPERRKWASYLFGLLQIGEARTDDFVAGRWRELAAMVRCLPGNQISKIKAKDAWHLALAESAHANVFVTVDEPLYKWCQAMRESLKVQVQGPEELSTDLMRKYRLGTWFVAP